MMLSKKKQLTLIKVNKHLLWHLLGALSFKVNDFRLGHPAQIPASLVDPVAQVYFFSIHKKNGVEKTDLIQDHPTNQQSSTLDDLNLMMLMDIPLGLVVNAIRTEPI